MYQPRHKSWTSPEAGVTWQQECKLRIHMSGTQNMICIRSSKTVLASSTDTHPFLRESCQIKNESSPLNQSELAKSWLPTFPFPLLPGRLLRPLMMVNHRAIRSMAWGWRNTCLPLRDQPLTQTLCHQWMRTITPDDGMEPLPED